MSRNSGKKLKGRVALVTGGGVRIGAAICRTLAAEGADVAVHYRKSAADADRLSMELRRMGVRAWHIKADLASEDACSKLVDEAIAVAGRLDILVNSAAVFNKDGLKSVTAEKLMHELRPNLFAPLFLIKSFANRCKRGSIVNLLDRRVAGNDTSCVPYLLSKKALADLTKMAALDLAPGFRVNAVAPGPILPPPGEGKQYLKEKGGKVPLETSFAPEDIAAAVVFLLLHEKITGQVIYVDGGQHLLGDAV